MNARSIARFGVLAAAAILIGYVEHIIPIVPAMPGIKLGLSNVAVLFALYFISWKSALALVVVKVLLSGMLFTGPVAMIYAFSGGLLSLLVMALSKRFLGAGTVGVSVIGAAAHNIAQCAVACLFIRPIAAIRLLPLLLIAGTAAGILTGFIAKATLKAFKYKQK